MFSMPSLILILVIVILLFGTKRLKSLGSDLGGALKGFKKAVNEDDTGSSVEQKDKGAVIAGQIINEDTKPSGTTTKNTAQKNKQ